MRSCSAVNELSSGDAVGRSAISVAMAALTGFATVQRRAAQANADLGLLDVELAL